MKNTKRFLVVTVLILLAGLLTACDPASFPYLVVDQVGVIDQAPYLRVFINTSFGLGMDLPGSGPYFASLDEGRSWQEALAPGEDFLPAVETPERKLVEACVPHEPEVCYRLSGQPSVEISTDGGQSWQIDWQMPAERQDYMARQPEMEDLLDVYPNTIPYDLAILETEGGHVVLVAYGNQGVLVKSANGEWVRVAIRAEAEEIRAATPLPYQAPDFATAIRVLTTENTWLSLMALTWLIFLAALGWSGITQRSANHKHSQVTWLYTLTVLSAVAFGLLGWLFVTTHLGGSPFDWQFTDIMLGYVCLLPGIILIVVVFAIGNGLPNQKAIWRAGLLALGLALLFLIVTWLPFGLWAWGILHRYSQALTGAGILALLSLVFSFLAIIRFARRAPIPPPAA
jgi:hypothetical protein